MHFQKTPVGLESLFISYINDWTYEKQKIISYVKKRFWQTSNLNRY